MVVPDERTHKTNNRCHMDWYHRQCFAYYYKRYRWYHFWKSGLNCRCTALGLRYRRIHRCFIRCKIANKPPDKEHPYGHGKAENIASIIVALLLVIVGIEIIFSSFKVFLREMPKAPRKLALIILIISIVMKEVLFQYKYRLGKKYNSTALVSEAWHHRSDALSSLAATAGVGFALAG